MHTYKVLYQDGNSVRRLKEVELPDAYHLIGVQKYTDFDKARGAEPNGSYPVIDNENFSELYGKMLTLCDATFTDPTQREAFKDMVKSTLSGWYGKNVDYTFKMAEQLNNK